MVDKHWWKRILRKLFNQTYEQAAIELRRLKQKLGVDSLPARVEKARAAADESRWQA
jgi:hypothetical protein